MSTPETVLVRSILQALAWKYRGKARFWRNNTGAVRSERGALVRFGEVGAPDILGIVRGGRLVAIEAKSASGRVSPAQRTWHEEAASLGAVVGVVRSVDEALALVEGALAGGGVSTTAVKTPSNPLP
jgi:hypothetical protein